MIKSMTGFGRGTYLNENREYSIEIKSVNHKYCDISIKMPRAISYLEENIKKQIQSAISRGKVDIFINFNNSSEIGRNIKINTEIANLYIKELKKLAANTNIIDNVNVMEITKLPDVLSIKNEEDEDIIWNELTIPLKEALDNFISMRTIEGEKIKSDLENRINNISKKVEEISHLSTGLVEDYVVKLRERIKELIDIEKVDENRLAQEVVIYADKCSVQEEITRLNSHISQFKTLINSNQACGKKIDFLLQEMNRETNTIGSKANNLELTNFVIDIKTELEDIREQIQNIE